MGYHVTNSMKVVGDKTFFIKERLQDIIRGYDLDFCEIKKTNTNEHAKIMYDQITHNSGGLNYHECVFQLNGKFYKTYYSEDSQYVSPYANDKEWIEVTSVVPKEVTVIKYV